MSSTSTPKRPPSSATASSKRTPATSTTSTSSSNSPAANTPNRSPSRMAADSSSSSSSSGNAPASSRATTTASTLNRARSVRNNSTTSNTASNSTANAPVSARAAARKTGPNNSTPSSASNPEADDAKAELQAKLDEAAEKLREAEHALQDSQKQSAVLQARLDEAVSDQGRLEEQAHEHSERVEELENERRDTLRARRELEMVFEADRASLMREKEEAVAREEELQGSLHRLKESLAAREMRNSLSTGNDDEGRRPSSVSRNGSFRSGNGSPIAEQGQFAPPSSLQRSDSKSSSRLVMQKDKIIEGLRLELAEAQIKLVELENQGGGRVHELQREIYEVKMQNARLMEDNESFQLLLSEKTLNGELVHSDLLRPPSRSPNQGTSLADELEGQNDEAASTEGNEAPDRRAQAEVNSLKDQNKALTLYINNIISRLLQHEQFEQILDKTPDLMAGPGALSRKFATVDTEKDLPPPPPPHAQAAGEDDASKLSADQAQQGQEGGIGGVATGFLQRARSVMGGRPKARPTSVYQPLDSGAATAVLETAEPRVHENPDTAPRVPLGRSASTRGHRRANSDWPAASVVTNMMYRGASPGSLQGPTSPGLTSPTLTGRNSFFGPGAGGSRVTSGGSMTSTAAIPSISEQEPSPLQPEHNKENVPFSTSPSPTPASTAQQPRPSTATTSLTEPDIITSSSSSPLPPHSVTASPPRSTTSSSGDRDRGEARSGAIMMGSKPRPLRLVQEAAGAGPSTSSSSSSAAAAAAEDDRARKAANRGSWFGWMGKGGVAPSLAALSGSGGGAEGGGSGSGNGSGAAQ